MKSQYNKIKKKKKKKTLKDSKYMFNTKIISYIKFYKDVTHKVYNLLQVLDVICTC